MSSKTELVKAIKNMKSVKFVYFSGKAPGVRIGDPHAIWSETLKNGTVKTYVHLWQTGGLSSSNKIQSWKKFSLDKINNVIIDDESFEVAKGYNPAYYKHVIQKV